MIQRLYVTTKIQPNPEPMTRIILPIPKSSQTIASSYQFFNNTSMVDRAVRTGKCLSCGGLHH